MERVSDLVHKQDVTIADVREKHASLQGQVEALGIALLGQGHAAQANYADGPTPALSGPAGANFYACFYEATRPTSSLLPAPYPPHPPLNHELN